MDISPQPSRHERHRLQTRQRLIESTLQLVLEKGFNSISIQDITDRADLGRGTFYIHFKDKEEVVWTAFQNSFQALEQEAHKQLDRQMPQVEYYGLLNIFNHAGNNRDIYRVIFGKQGSASLSALAQDFLANVFLEDIRKAPPPSGVNFYLPEEVETQILVGIITRMLFWWLETSNDYSAEKIASMIYIAIYRKQPPV